MTWETVDDDVLRVSTTRVERLSQCAAGGCVCLGRWLEVAQRVRDQNSIDPDLFWHSLYMCLHDGRREDKPVMVSVGRRGGEGKSYLFAPLAAVFGADMVQTKPEPGRYPLMELPKCRVAVLDEWRFDETVLSMATQFFLA